MAHRPTFLLHFNGHLLTFQDILGCLTVKKKKVYTTDPYNDPTFSKLLE